MDIGQAVAALREGKRVTRRGWNGRGQYLVLWRPRRDDPIEILPYVAISLVSGSRIPWVCSQGDLLATDWELTL